MIKIENIEVTGWRAALRGMRNPMNSWGRADSTFLPDGRLDKLGPNDLDLMRRLYRAGRDHRKYLRMIHVQMDITAPLYWWKDYDTYKVGTVANSCSTMHKIQESFFTTDMFSCEHLDEQGMNLLQLTCDYLNSQRKTFNDSNKLDKMAWYRMIQMLPSSYEQKRTVDLSYEVVFNILQARSNHRLFEFRELCSDELMKLPYIAEIMDID